MCFNKAIVESMFKHAASENGPLGKCHFLSGGGPLEIFQVL